MVAQIDVLIPAFNAAKTIRASLRSILAQEDVSLRAVVVDDGSTDDTVQIISEMALKDERIYLITNAHGGIVQALNIGLSHCDAPFIARHDADDHAFSRRLVEQYRYLTTQADCIAVGCRAYVVDEMGHRTGQVTVFCGQVTGDPLWVPAREPYIMHPFLMVRRDALLAAGGYRHVLHAEDTDLYWRLLPLGRLYNMDQILGEYRQHVHGVSSASVVNGRAASVFSQLAAISAQRITRSEPDLLFSKEFADEVCSTLSLKGMIEHASQTLTRSEKRMLTVSASAKLLELASHRSFALETEDLRSARTVLKNKLAELPWKNWREIVVSYKNSTIRYTLLGRSPPSADVWFDRLLFYGVYVSFARKLWQVLSALRLFLTKHVRAETVASRNLP